MSRSRWEQVLFANVRDEVAQDALNGVMLEVEAENDELRRERDELRDRAHDMLWCNLVGDCLRCKWGQGDKCELDHAKMARELGIEIEVDK